MVLVANNPPDESKAPIHNSSVEMDNMDWDGLDGALKKVSSFFLTNIVVSTCAAPYPSLLFPATVNALGQNYGVGQALRGREISSRCKQSIRDLCERSEESASGSNSTSTKRNPPTPT